MNNPSPLESIFFAALAKPSPAERCAFLDEACVSDVELRRRVERMLDAQSAAGSFLEQPAVAGDVTVNHEPPITERPGTVIGPYKLLQQIGEGGMGVVFMAEQSEPIQRTVALKIIKPGMDTRQVIARFEAERQTVAMMDHPNIATVLDAGTTDTGRPYFVMELVKGVPITKYCDEKHLPLRQRLELFMHVCQAVQHAHQKGIIHRDIKPNNVLVAEYDNRAVPKVIDFGVAKATAQRLTERTMFTEFGQVLGTMEYMSPEQSKFNQLDIDTRSDIYSLGVLLYELLSGSTPFEGKRLHEAAFDEMLRIIREEEPPKPSTRISSIDTLPSVAANRGVEPLKLNRLVQGELDWIVMKAMEKDRNRRYETASGFAADIERHLNDEPVEACPPSATYRLRKFARRNKGLVAAVAAVLLALVLGSILSTIGFIQASRQRAVAQDNAARADREANSARNEAEKQQAVSYFVTDILGGAGAIDTDTDTTFLQVLDRASRKLEEGSLSGRPEIEATLRANLYTTYRRLGQLEVAERHLRKAIELAKQAYGPEHPLVAEYLHDLCEELLPLQQKWTEAEQVAREALSMYQRLFGEGSLETIIELNVLRQILEAEGRADEAEQLFQQAVAIAQKSLREGNIEPAKTHKVFSPNLTQRVAGTCADLAQKLRDRNEFSDAEALYQAALAIERKEFGEGHRDVEGILHSLADVLRAQGKNDEAEELFRQSVAIQRKVGADSAGFAITITRLAEALVMAGKLAEAEALHREALAIRRKVFAEESEDVGASLASLASVLQAQERTAEIEPLWRESEAILRKAAPDSAGLATTITRLADVLVSAGNLSEAESLHREALAIRRKVFGEESGEVGLSLQLLTSVLQAQERTAEFEALWRERLEYWQKELAAADKPQRLAEIHLRMFRSLMNTGQVEQAKTSCRRALELNPNYAGADRALSSNAWQLTTSADPAHRDPALALELATKAVELGPQDTLSWQVLGWAHYRTGNWQDSIDALEKSCKLQNGGVGDSFQWFFLAMAHWQLGNKEETHKWYEESVKWMEKNTPDHEDALRFRAEAAELLGVMEPHSPTEQKPPETETPNTDNPTLTPPLNPKP